MGLLYLFLQPQIKLELVIRDFLVLSIHQKKIRNIFFELLVAEVLEYLLQ